MTSTLYSAKAQRGRRSKNFLWYEETFCLRGSFNFAHLFHCECWGKIISMRRCVMDSDPGDSNYIVANALDCAALLWTVHRIQRKKEE